MASTSTQTVDGGRRRSQLDRLVWPAQSVAAVLCGLLGVAYLIAPTAAVSSQMASALDLSPLSVRGLGIVQLAAAAGLIVPNALGRFPRVASLAAAFLAILLSWIATAAADGGDHQLASASSAIALLCAFVAWRRWR